MMYNRQTPCIYANLRVVYHGIPKNASTSVKNALYEYEHGHEFNGNKQWIHKGNTKGGSIYPDLYDVKTTYADYFHFTVVRDPIDRFLSFYNDLFAGTTNIRHNVPPFYSDNNITLEPKPIDDVIKIIEWFSDDQSDEHFASQSSFVHSDCAMVIKMESLDIGWKGVCKAIGVDYKQLPSYNKSLSTISLTEQQKQRIRDRYKIDYERFGYEV